MRSANLRQKLEVSRMAAGELNVTERDDPGARAGSLLEVAHGPANGRTGPRKTGDGPVGQQHQLDAALLLQPPGIMVRRILVNVADDLIARLEAVAVGDQPYAFGGVLDERQVVRRSLQKLGSRLAQSIQDRIVSPIDQSSRPVLRLGNFAFLPHRLAVKRRDAAG